MGKYAIGDDNPQWCDLAAPRCSKLDPETPSWTVSNPSSYLMDSGLWTACKESREIMEKRYDTLGWRQRCREHRYTTLYCGERPDAPATNTFTSNGETQCFTTYPKSDLFCLQPYDFDTVDWVMLREYVPIFNYQFGFDVNHVALEFDPKFVYPNPDCPLSTREYRFGYNSDGAVGCFARAASDDLALVKHLWIIDYRIKRLPGPLPLKHNGHEFHDSSGRFLEVGKWDQGWHVDYIVPGSKFDNLEAGSKVISWTDPYVFAEDLKEALDCVYDEPDIGVLAYEAWT